MHLLAINKLFEYNPSKYHTRQFNQLKVPICKTAAIYKSICFNPLALIIYPVQKQCSFLECIEQMALKQTQNV